VLVIAVVATSTMHVMMIMTVSATRENYHTITAAYFPAIYNKSPVLSPMRRCVYRRLGKMTARAQCTTQRGGASTDA
jgi:hypothetical protein